MGSTVGGDTVVTNRLDVVALALPPPPPEPVVVFGRAWLDGHVLANKPVMVGRATVKTDAEGRFRVRVRASGRVRLTVDRSLGRSSGPTPCLLGVHEDVEVVPGKSRYWVALHERSAPRGYCEH